MCLFFKSLLIFPRTRASRVPFQMFLLSIEIILHHFYLMRNYEQTTHRIFTETNFLVSRNGDLLD